MACPTQILNPGIKKAKRDILVTIDADSTMTSNMLTEIDFGERFLFKLLIFKGSQIKKKLKNKNTKFIDKYFYDFKR